MFQLELIIRCNMEFAGGDEVSYISISWTDAYLQCALLTKSMQMPLKVVLYALTTVHVTENVPY